MSSRRDRPIDELELKKLHDSQKSSKLVGLHVHSENSFLDGFSTAEMIARRAAELGQSAVAITDHGECSGHLKLEKAAQRYGIKPILGMEGYMVDNIQEFKAIKAEKGKPKKNSHYSVWAKNKQGLKNLWSLSTLAYYRENFYQKPLVDWKLFEEYREGLIVSDGCLLSNMARFILKDDIDNALQRASKFLDIFGDDFVMELHTHQLLNPVTEEDKAFNAEMTKMNLGKVEVAQQLGVPLVVVNDAHYAWREDWLNHSLVWKMNTSSDDQTDSGEAAAWIMSEEEMVEWMAKHGINRSVTEEAIRNTSEVVADQCDVEIEKRIHYPAVSKGGPEKELEIYKHHTEEGFQRKIVGQNYSEEYVKEARARLDYENDLIISKGFPGYFNVVADYIKYAKMSDPEGKYGPIKGKEPWLVGPARGSAGGSLAAYCYDITELNPLDYGLLFERFMDPGRKSFPDIDVDFPQSKRPLMREYIEWKYGKDRICAVGNLQRLQPRGILKDLGRAMSLPFEDVQKMSKIIEQVKDIDTANIEISWEEIVEEKGGDLAKWAKQYPELFHKIDEMLGLVRQSSTHAAGILISDESLLGELPLRIKGEEGTLTSQFENSEEFGAEVEEMGFIKFDFLGIRHLDTLMETDRMVNGIHDPRRFYDMSQEDLANEHAWDQVAKGYTTGVFQLEANSMTGVTRDFKPRNEREVSQLIAVNRPGVVRSGNLQPYLDIRAGKREPSFTHPLMKQITGDTNGIIVYQEQCVSGSTSVKLPDGSKMPIRDAAYRETPEIMAMWPDGTIRPHKVEKFIRSGKKNCIRVKCVGRRSIDLTPDHRLLTTEGYKEARDIRVGDTLINDESWTQYTPEDLQGRSQRMKTNPAFSEARSRGNKKGLEVIRKLSEDKEWTRNRARGFREAWNDPEQRVQMLSVIVEKSHQRYSGGSGFGQKTVLSDGRVCDSYFESLVAEELLSRGVEFELHKILPEGKVCDFYVNGRYWEADGMGRGEEYWEAKYGDRPYLVLTPQNYREVLEDQLSLDAVSNGVVVESVTEIGEREVYDVIMSEGGPSNFLANGIVTHNCMKVVSLFANYSLVEADRIRKIMGKMLFEKMKEEKPEFIRRCMNNPEFVKGCTAEQDPYDVAEYVWKQIESAGIYSFNLSHSVGYAMIVCWGAYLRHNYPREYITALLQTDSEQLTRYMTEAAREEIPILPPDINDSGPNFTLTDAGIRYGLSTVRGVGPRALTEILKAKKPFHDLQEYLDQTSGQGAKKKGTVINLIKVGAFDSIGDREMLLKELKEIRWAKDKADVFPEIPDFNDPAVIADIELEVIGTYVTQDPMKPFLSLIERECIKGGGMTYVNSLPEKAMVQVGGKLTKIKTHVDRNGNTMAFLGIEWQEEDYDIVVFSDKYKAYKPFLEVNKPVVVEAIRIGSEGVYLKDLVRLDMLS